MVIVKMTHTEFWHMLSSSSFVVCEMQSEQRHGEGNVTCHWAGTGSSLCPKCLDTSRMSRRAGLVKADGGAEPTCKIHFLSIRSLDKSMNHELLQICSLCRVFY